MNRQGPDVGAQYRSVIFFHNDEQKAVAEKSKADLESSEKYSDSVVTAIETMPAFYRAEEYHQKYFLKTGKKVCH